MSILIKGGRIITAADDYTGDVFVDGERVTLIGESLDVQADRVIDATGKYVLPAGVDVHTHMDTPFGGTDHRRQLPRRHDLGRVRRRRHDHRLLPAAAGPELPPGARHLARQARGAEAGDRRRLPHRDHGPQGARHARRSGPPAGRGRDELQALHGLQGRGHGRRRDALQEHARRGRQRRRGDGARRERRRDRRARQGALAAGNTSPEVPRADAPARARGRGDEPRDPARPRRRLAAVCGARLVHRRDRADRAGARGRLERLGRDLLAVPPDRLLVHRPARVRGRQVRLHAAAAREAPPRGAVGGAAHRHALGGLDRPRARSTSTGRRTWARTTSPRSRTARPASRSGSRSCTSSASARAGWISTAWSSCGRRTRPSSSASTRARARSRSAATPTSSSSIPRRSTRCRSRRHHSSLRLQPLRGHRGHRRAGDHDQPRRRSSWTTASSRPSRATASTSSAPAFNERLSPQGAAR